MLLALAGAAAAQVQQSSAAKPGGRGIRANRNAPIVFEADEVQYDEQLALTIARGHVEISQSGQTLLADVVTYNQRTDTVTASGHVSLTQPTGEVLFSNFMELRDNMTNGFAKDVRMLLSDRSRLAANTGRRTGGNRTELARGVYSPCDLCPQKPTAPPTWQLEARQIDHDQEAKLVEFRDAIMEIDGFPIFYTPYLSTPDPSVKRQSGFLSPTVGDSSSLGAHVTIPYYWVIDQDKDLTLAPRMTTKAGGVLGEEYREAWGNGYLDAQGSLNFSVRGEASSEDSLGPSWRGNINATGEWDLDQTWRTGLQLQRVSDQTYLLRFGFGNPIIGTEVSHAYLQGFEPRAMTDIDGYIFQPLLPGLGDSTQPIVMPVANRTWQSGPDALGGQWTFNANLLNIVREVGTQTRRLSAGAEWDRTFRDGIGGEYKLTASLRGDAYSVGNLSAVSNPDLPSAFFAVNGMPPVDAINHDFLAGRAFPQVGLQWDYPLIRRGALMTALVEPIAAVYAGPNAGNNRRIPDEDSLNFNFDDTDLFRPDRLAGYDILDTGQRVDYGLKLGLYDKNGGSYRALVGQSYRMQDNPFLTPGSGAEQKLSDIVGRIVLSPSSYLDLIYRFRFDKNTLADRTQEVGLSAGPPTLRVSGNFILLPPQQQSDVVTSPITGQEVLYGKREQLSFDVTAKLTHYWSLRGIETINLTNSSDFVNGVATPIASSSYLYSTLALVYQDECLAFVGSITQSGVRSGDVTPGVSLLLSVVFKNLGEVGSTVASISGNTGTPPQ